MSYTGSITENRVAIQLPAVLRNWLAEEARHYGITVPALVRHKLMILFEAKVPPSGNRPQ